jgi:hypothetical protein
MTIKGKLKKHFDRGDLESVIEHCWDNNLDTHRVLKTYRDIHGLTVEDTDRVRNRLSRRKQYKTGKAQEYVKKRYDQFDFTAKPAKRNPNGTRKWEKNDYANFLKFQEKGKSEVEIARALKTNLVIVKYLRTKRKLAMQVIEKKKLKSTPARVVSLMHHGENTLRKIINGEKVRSPVI